MNDERLRVIERGYLRERLIFEKPARWLEPGDAVAEMGRASASAIVSGELDMIELEFPDLPPDERFFRIGTNPAGMRQPIDLSRVMKG